MDMSDATLRAFTAAIVEQAARKIPVPRVLPGTVVVGQVDSGPTTRDLAADTMVNDPVLVLMDGTDEEEPTYAQSIIGGIKQGDRVMVLFNPPSGALIIGGLFNHAWQGFDFGDPLSNGWSVPGSLPIALGPPRWRLLSEGIVTMDGVIGGGTLGLPAFTLPEPYRPTREARIVCDADDGFGRFVIGVNGDVVPQVGSTTLFSLTAMWVAGNTTPKL